MKLLRIINLLFLMLGVALQLPAAGTQEIAPEGEVAVSLSERIGEEYCRSFPRSHGEEAADDTFAGLNKQKQADIDNLELDEDQLRPTIFRILGQREISQRITHGPDVLKPQIWRDLNIFYNPDSPSSNLLNRINRTTTVCGEAYLAQLIVHLNPDATQLKKRQAIVKELINPESTAHTQLIRSLETIKREERTFLKLWNEENPMVARAINNTYLVGTNRTDPQWMNICDAAKYAKATAVIGGPLWVSLATLLPVWLALKKVNLVQASYPSFAADVITRVVRWTWIVLTSNEDRELARFGEIPAVGDMAPVDAIGAAANAVIPLIRDQVQQISSIEKSAAALGVSVTGVIAAGFYFWWLNNYIKNSDVQLYMQKKLNSLAVFTREMHRISHIIKKHPALSENLEHYQMLVDLEKKATTVSDKLKLLDDLLKTRQCRKETSRWELFGNVLAAFQLMEEVRDEFAGLLTVVGEVDAFCSTATLMKEHDTRKNRQGEPLTFCFVEYSSAKTPLLEVSNFWNPMLADKSRIVPTDIVQGGLTHARNSIITGPNTGGKSTTLHAAILGVILGQSIGIAPAQRMSFTPFTSIITHLNIKDNAAKGESKFMAEAKRATDVIEAVARLKPHEFILVIMDEIFSGTEPGPGQECAFAVAELLGSYPNAIIALATHYKRLTELDRQVGANYQNLHVSVHEKDTKLEFPYKIESGVANVNVAIRILEERFKKLGLPTQFINKAKERLAAGETVRV